MEILCLSVETKYDRKCLTIKNDTCTFTRRIQIIWVLMLQRIPGSDVSYNF